MGKKFDQAVFTFTFYYIYIKTNMYESIKNLIEKFTFYYIYIKTY